MDMYIVIKQFVVAVLLLVAFQCFALKAGRLVALMRSVKGSTPVPAPTFPGKHAMRTWLQLMRIFCTDIMAQTNVRKKKAIGLAHMAIFFGFLCVQPHSLELMIRGIVPSFSWYALLPVPFYTGFMFLADCMALCCLLGFAYVLYRRLVLSPPYLPKSRDAYLIILFTTLIVLTYLVLNALATVSIYAGNGHLLSWVPISKIIAFIFNMKNWSDSTTTCVFECVYWIHLCIILGFLVYIPGSKHLHLLAAVPNVLLKPDSVTKRIARTDVENEDAETFGLGFINEINWKQALDLYSCTECGRCEEQCPAARTGKSLSPRQLVHDLKIELFEQAESVLSATESLPAIIRDNGHVLANHIWDCTSCRACEEACPVNIQHLDFLFELRKHQVLMEAAFPAELGDTFSNLENQSNPWGFSSAGRGNWAKDLDIPHISQAPDAEILYFAGSALSLDDRGQKISRALMRVLQAAKVKVAILGADEQDSGDDARRSGNEYLAQMIIRTNVETLNGFGIKTILTACPHTYNILKNEYPDFGGTYRVLHHSEFLHELIATGRLRLPVTASSVRFTYHDPCYLGRWNGILDAPRRILQSLGKDVACLEMEARGTKSLCCGGGGGRMFMEEHGQRINTLRAEQAAATGADVLAVACPYCMIMLADGLKESDSSMRIMDLAEIIEELLFS